MEIRNILVRRCIPIDRFEAAVTFHEALVGEPARLRFDHPTVGLRLTQVASILFIGGPPDRLKMVAETAATFLVDDLDAYCDYLPTVGADVIRRPQVVPTGRNMLVRHPDGMQVEYVQHDHPNPADHLSRSD
jgi:predicted enzyme related to lactoylglutathione lyase